MAPVRKCTLVSTTLLLLVLLMSAACAGAPDNVSLASEAREHCGEPADADYYFPHAVFQLPDVNDESARRVYSAYLHVSREAPLSCGSERADQETYRLILLHP